MTHPITPPPELVQHWASEWMRQQNCNRDNFMTERAAQWGADQELEACCEWFRAHGVSELSREAYPKQLRTARRPKPPSLKEQALAELEKVDMLWDIDEFGHATMKSLDTIRRALEQLDD